MIPSFQFRGKGSGTARFHLQGRALQVSGENHPRPAPVFSPKTLPVEAVRILAPEIGNDMFHLLIANDHESKGMYRKTENRQMDKKAAAAFIMFSYLYSRGISPVWAAVAIVCFRGFFRFLYKIACLLVAAAILFCILSCLVF